MACPRTSQCKVRITILVTWGTIHQTAKATKAIKADESMVAVDTKTSLEITTPMAVVDSETEVIEAIEEVTEEIEAAEMIVIVVTEEIEEVTAEEEIEVVREAAIEETEVKEVIEVIAEVIEAVTEEILGIINTMLVREKEWTTSREIRDLIAGLLVVEAGALREGIIEKVASETIITIKIEKEVEKGTVIKEETLISHMTEKVVMIPLEAKEEVIILVTGSA